MPSLTRSEARRRRRREHSRRPWIWVGVALLVVAAAGAWVGIRGYLAKGELEAAVPLASQVKAQVVSGDADAAVATADALAGHSRSAAELTSDPVWRAVEILPWVGPNLRVVRELAGTVDDVAENGIDPLTGLAGAIELSDFKPVDGRIDLQPMLDAQPKLLAASEALDVAVTRVDAIDTTGVLQPLVDARQKLSDTLSDAAGSLAVVTKAAQLVPAMLGVDGPRNYLVLFQNNAELRATGGIPGAMALVQTDGGALDLVKQDSANKFPRYDEPVLPLSQETRALYGDNTGRYMQDVNFTPNFTLSAQLAREMWNRQFGLEVDGVLSLDPVALSYLLKATGPIALPSGDELTSENSVKLLLQDVYAKFEKPSDQDEFFAAAAAAVFERVASGKIDPKALVEALAHAGDERRVLLWSAHEEDQSILADTTLAGGLPVSTDDTQRFGVYFNDATTAKMDPYLKVEIGAGQAVCRNDGLPTNSVRVTLTNIAPPDSGSVLPNYVTGGGEFGIPPGNIRTNITVYGAPGLYNLGVARDGARVPYQPALDLGYGVSKLQIELTPGESTVLDFTYLGDSPGKKDLVVENTPLVYSLETSQVEIDCTTALK